MIELIQTAEDGSRTYLIDGKRFAVPASMPESQVEAEFHREQTDAEKLAEAKANAIARIQSNTERQLEQHAGGRRQLQRLTILGDGPLRAKLRQLQTDEDAAIAAVEAATTVEEVANL